MITTTQPTPIPSSLPAHSLCSAVPTTQLTLDRLSVLCRPVFEKERLKNPMLAWVGIFGSVQRGTQRPDSDVDFLVGYDERIDFRDIRGTNAELLESLPKILGREIDLVVFRQNNHHFAHIHMEALLTAKTIWGDPSWVHSSREAAERHLREGYKATKKALQVASRLKAKLPSSQAEFVSPENKALRLSILEDALLVITTVKIPKNAFYIELKSMIPRLLAKENAIRAAIEGEVESSEDLGALWDAVSDWIIVVALRGMIQAGDETFTRAGLGP